MSASLTNVTTKYDMQIVVSMEVTSLIGASRSFFSFESRWQRSVFLCKIQKKQASLCHKNLPLATTKPNEKNLVPLNIVNRQSIINVTISLPVIYLKEEKINQDARIIWNGTMWLLRQGNGYVLLHMLVPMLGLQGGGRKYR